MTQPNPLYTANHMQMMAQRSGNEKLALALNTVSVVMLTAIAIETFMKMYYEHNKQAKDRGRGRG